MRETLRDARRRIEELASEDGQFSLTCARTGECPLPVTGKRFDTPDDARRAAAIATEYRETLRERDPDLPTHRLVVAEEPASPLQFVSTREFTGEYRSNGVPRSRRQVTVAGEADGEWLRMDNAPLVHITQQGTPLDDELVTRQLEAKL